MTTAAEKFWAKAQRGESGECWLWAGRLLGSGYGRLWSDGKSRLAHRFAYEFLVGPIPSGMVIDHLCRVRHCVNPDHMEPVSPKVNTIRGIGPSALNARKVSCPQGHAYDEANVLAINGKRYCRECKRKQNAEYRARRGTVRLTPEQRARKTELQRLRRSAEQPAQDGAQ